MGSMISDRAGLDSPRSIEEDEAAEEAEEEDLGGESIRGMEGVRCRDREGMEDVRREDTKEDKDNNRGILTMDMTLDLLLPTTRTAEEPTEDNNKLHQHLTEATPSKIPTDLCRCRTRTTVLLNRRTDEGDLLLLRGTVRHLKDRTEGMEDLLLLSRLNNLLLSRGMVGTVGMERRLLRRGGTDIKGGRIRGGEGRRGGIREVPVLQ
jgi:hypothetical protein